MKYPEVDAKHRSRASYTSVLCPKPKLRSGCAQPSNSLGGGCYPVANACLQKYLSKGNTSSGASAGPLPLVMSAAAELLGSLGPGWASWAGAWAGKGMSQKLSRPSLVWAQRQPLSISEQHLDGSMQQAVLQHTLIFSVA